MAHFLSALVSCDECSYWPVLPIRARWYLQELTLNRGFSDEPLIPPDIPPALRLNITLRRDGRLRASMSGDGATLDLQLQSAIQAAIRDRRYGGEILMS